MQRVLPLQKYMAKFSKLLTITGATAITSAAIGYHLATRNSSKDMNSMMIKNTLDDGYSKNQVSKKNYVTVSRVKDNHGYSTILNRTTSKSPYSEKNPLKDYKVSSNFTLKSTNDLM